MSGRHHKVRPTSLRHRIMGGVVVGAAIIGAGAYGAAEAPPALSIQRSPTADPYAAAMAALARPSAGVASRGGGKSLGGASRGGGIAEVLSAGAVRPASAAPAVTAADAVRLAQAQVGIAEDAAGGGTKFQTWYVGSARARQTASRDGGSPSGYENAEWCDMFVSWLGAQLGFSDQFGADAYVPDHARWFADRHRWGSTPKPGAVVFFSWSGGHGPDSAGHVGLVVKDDGNGSITTIEGNTGNAVRRRVRATSLVAGYGYPGYAAA